jgi:CRP-like cAMP-binding protein
MSRKLGMLADLDEVDREALRSLPLSIERVEAGYHLVREGTEPGNCCLLVTGYACRNKVTLAGQRQIVSFHMAGDLVDLQHLHLSVADHHVQTITRAEVAWIPKANLLAVARKRPGIAEALWRDTLVDASIFREWVLNVGRRDARSAIAHMLCEFAVRAEAVGLGTADTFRWPLTQEQIADATGLTPVHVNRMLKSLAADGLIERSAYGYRVSAWSELKRVAAFDKIYLHAAAA